MKKILKMCALSSHEQELSVVFNPSLAFESKQATVRVLSCKHCQILAYPISEFIFWYSLHH